MTYVLAWINNNVAYLIGDTSITTFDEEVTSIKKESFTSFGEKEIKEKGVQIQEGALKIWNIENKILLGYAGSPNEVREVIELIDKHIRLAQRSDYYNLVLDAIENIKPQELEIIFSYREADSFKVRLFKYLSNKSSIEEILYASWIGIKPIQFPFGNILQLNDTFNNLEHDHLVSVCALLTTKTVNYSLLKDKIGGMFTGGFINSKGLQWMRDITYFLYYSKDPKKDSFIVNTMIRNNLAVSYNTNGNKKIIVNYYGSSNKFPGILHELNKNILPKIEKSNGQYFCFVAFDKEITTILPSRNNIRNCYIKLLHSKTQLKLGFNDLNLLHLLQRVPKRDFTFVWVNKPNANSGPSLTELRF